MATKQSTPQVCRSDAYVALAPPFDRVEISWWAHPDQVRYTIIGHPEELVGSGAVEAIMVERDRPGQRRFDSHGDRFCRSTKYGSRAGQLEISRAITSLKCARVLPGVPRDLSVECIAWLHAHPGRIHSSPLWYSGCETMHAGSLDALADVGLLSREELALAANKSVRREWAGNSEYFGNGAYVHWLLDGFYGVSGRSLAANPKRSSHLRLVVSNDAPGGVRHE